MSPADDRPGPPAHRKTEFLILEARSGDEAAWRELYGRYQRMLLVAVECRMPGFLQRRFDAEDVLQDAFYKAWNNIERFEYQGEGSFRRWLRRIVLNEFRNVISAQRREQRSPGSEDGDAGSLDSTADERPAPSQLLKEMEEKRDVLARLANLDEDEQEIISMRIFEDMSWVAVGRVLGCDRETAKRRFDHAIKHLAQGIS